MHLLRFAAFVLAGLVACSQNPVSDQPDQSSQGWEAVALNISPAVYMLGFLTDSTQFDGISIQLVGTGFAVSPHRIITNAHVASVLNINYDNLPVVAVQAGEQRIQYSQVRFPKQFAIHPDYTGSLYSSDLAVLLCDSVLPDTLPVASDEDLAALDIGQSIATIGFPGTTHLWLQTTAMPTFKEGTVSAMHPLEKADPLLMNSFFLQHNLDLTGGTSGSPIFNAAGHVVGINNSGVSSTAVGYGISAACIEKLKRISEFDTLVQSGDPAARAGFRIFREGSYVDGMRFDTTELEAMKVRWGYDYVKEVENDSLLVVRFTDHSTFRVYAFIEKAGFYARTRDRCVMYLITNTPGQSALNPFVQWYSSEISVGASKHTIQNEYGVCYQKETVGEFLVYPYVAGTDFYYSQPGAAFLFSGADEFCSAIAVFTGSRKSVPCTDYFTNELIPRYGAAVPSDSVPGDGTIVVTYTNGDTMAIRTYRSGLLDGEVEERDPGGVVRFRGLFVNGQKHGLCRYFDELGLLEGASVFALDTLHGQTSTFYHSPDTSAVFTYDKGILQGPLRRYYLSGVLKEESWYTDGELDGDYRTFFTNTKPKIVAMYRMGAEDSVWLEYDSSGTLLKEIHYRDGVMHGLNRVYFDVDSVQIKTECFYVNGIEQGISKTYYSNGKLSIEQAFVDGRSHGVTRRYRIDGTLQKESNYENGRLNGTDTDFHPGGILPQIVSLYIEGVIVKKTVYALDGTVMNIIYY